MRSSSGVLHSVLGLPEEERHGAVREDPEEDMLVRGLLHFCYGDRLQQLELFNIGKRRLWGVFIAAFQYIKAVRMNEDIIPGSVVRG